MQLRLRQRNRRAIMSLRDNKVKKVEEIKNRLNDARAIVLVDYKGVNVEEDNILRSKFREDNVDYFIAKNSLIKLALQDLGIDSLDSYLVGPTAVAVSKEDEVAPARVIRNFVDTELEKEKKELLSFKIGLVSNDLFDSAQLNQLASLPSREELIAKVLASLNSPISGFVGALQGVIRKFVYCVDEIAKSKTN